MKLEMIKKKMAMISTSKESWLKNQFPAEPSERLNKINYLNYQNIEDCFDKETMSSMKKYIDENLNVKVLVLVSLDENGKPIKKPRAFVNDEVKYYTMYELFASSANMKGFIEIFHNIRPKEKTK
jgi:hypothetical protein